MNKDTQPILTPKPAPTGVEFPVYNPAGLPDSDAKQFGLDASHAVSKLAHQTHMKEMSAIESSMQRLIDSNVVTAAEGAIGWREGHLEHVARAYVADQRLAWRDYNDDLTVALSADGSAFEALVKRARGE